MKKAMLSLEQFLELTKTREVLFFDVETTGFKGSKDSLLSFSGIKGRLDDGKFKETGRFDQMFDPEIFIPEHITEINHIDNQMVESCPKEYECPDIIRAFTGDHAILVGYNVGFDMRFMDDVYAKFDDNFLFDEIFDVYALAKRMNLPGLENKKLSTLTTYFQADEGLEFHCSIDDVVATYRVLEKLLERNAEGMDVSLVMQEEKQRKDMFYLGIFGPNGFVNEPIIHAWLDASIKNRNPEDVCFVLEGEEGTSAVASKYAREHGIETKVYRTDFERYGKRAYAIRNSYLHKFLDGRAENRKGAIVFNDGYSINVRSHMDWQESSSVPTKVVDLAQYRKK